MSDLPVFRDFVIARKDDPNTALRFEDESYSYQEYVARCAERAAFLLAKREPGPLHVGVLLENVPEFPMWLGATALAGATLVGINPTRRGAELARDIRHTDCQLIVTETRYRDMLEGLDLPIGSDRILDVDTPAYRKALLPYAGAEIPEVEVDPKSTLLLIFTSGTSGAPKAVICSQTKLALMGLSLIGICGIDSATVSYQSMPLFHSNGLFTGYAPTLIAGGTAALRRKFSASGFIEDVRKFGATYFNYVGKPLTYILATPERANDADNTLEFVFGNEAADLDIGRFEQRFSVTVRDGYGSTETGASISRTDDMPSGALGVAAEGVLVLDPETSEECPRAVFDQSGRITNAEAATGEIVNTAGGGFFEGYYNNDEANAARLRDGMFWTGDLGYRDAAGYFYFAGRDYEWLRVDGENFSAAPVERILSRFENVVLASVYAVPDIDVGDQVMAALQMNEPERFDPAAFAKFLSEQSDLGTKWAPRYVRLSRSLPITQTSKVQKRQLRAERWESDEPVYFAPTPGAAYRRLEAEDAAQIKAAFAARGRSALLD
jgi:fatty-acyl-CoA synthase